MFRYLIILVLFLSTTSCMTMGSKEPGKRCSIDSLESQTVSLLNYNEQDKVWRPYCTAVWVDDITFITAYHCAVAAKVESMTEGKLEAYELGQALDTMGAPVFYGVKTSFTNIIHKGTEEKFEAKVVAGDGEHDIAIMETTGARPEHESAEPKVGEDIELMGNPGGVEYTYARGYVSAYRNDIENEDLGIHGPFLQVNVGISGGNSGGGVFNDKRKLVGIVSFTNGQINVQGFCVPLGTIKKILKTYHRTKKKDNVGVKITKPTAKPQSHQ
jgi:V8-like Glu-specific endopeptidase